jgi:hypothetical protein
MEGHNEVGDAHWLDNRQDDGALDLVTGSISAMGLGGADMEVVDVAGTGAERQRSETGQEREAVIAAVAR